MRAPDAGGPSSSAGRAQRFEVQAGEAILRGVLHLPFRERPPCVVASHGLFSTKDGSKYVALARSLARRGIACIRYDHQGCGESGGDIGRTTVASRAADLDAVLRFARAHPLLGGPIGLFGSSMGGLVSLLRCASDPGIAAVVVWATPTHITAPTRGAPGWAGDLPPGFLADAPGLDARREAGAVRRCLVVHGSADRVVPVSHARSLFRALGTPKELLILDDADHSVTDEAHRRIALESSVRWFRRHLGPSRTRSPALTGPAGA